METVFRDWHIQDQSEEANREEYVIKKHAVKMARKSSNPVRRQEIYNNIRFPKLALEGLSEQDLKMVW